MLSVAAQRRYNIGDVAFRLAKGNKEKLENNWHQATKTFESLLGAYPDVTEAWFVLGVLYGRLRNAEEDGTELKWLYLKKELASKKMASLNCNRAIPVTCHNTLVPLITQKSHSLWRLTIFCIIIIIIILLYLVKGEFSKWREELRLFK